MKTFVFIGGRQLGVNCLRELLARNLRPILVIGNMNDDGRDTDLDESVVRIAKDAGLPLLSNARISDAEVIDRIHALRPEIAFNMYGTQRISSELLKIPPQGWLNIHPAPLPRYRGRYSTVHAIFNGETEHGVTLHVMDEGIDSGPIVSQCTIPIHDTDTAKDLWDRCTAAGTALFAEFLDSWLKGDTVAGFPQNEASATYYPKGLPNNGEIDWSWDGEKILRFVRAMTFEPYPPPSFRIGNKKMVIVDRRLLQSE